VTGSAAGVDDAEPVALGVGEHDEVGVLRIEVPVDALGPEGDQAIDLGRLVRRVTGVQVEVDPRVLLTRGCSCTGVVLRPSARPGPTPSGGTSTVQSSCTAPSRRT
jgi:hypothetical protein